MQISGNIKIINADSALPASVRQHECICTTQTGKIERESVELEIIIYYSANVIILARKLLNVFPGRLSRL